MGFLDECLKYALTEGAKALGEFIDTKLSGYKYNANCPHCNSTLGFNTKGVITCVGCKNDFAYKPEHKNVCKCEYCQEYTIFKKNCFKVLLSVRFAKESYPYLPIE